jgi:site-specific DNA recombinase
MSANGKDRSGRVRVRCSAATESGSYSKPKTFYLEKIEELVLRTISAELRQAEVIGEYLRACHEERKRLAAVAIAKRSPLEWKRNELTREIDRFVDAIGRGHLASDVA